MKYLLRLVLNCVEPLVPLVGCARERYRLGAPIQVLQRVCAQLSLDGNIVLDLCDQVCEDKSPPTNGEMKSSITFFCVVEIITREIYPFPLVRANDAQKRRSEANCKKAEKKD